MIKIKYNNTEGFIDTEFRRVSEHVVHVFSTEPNLSGFKTFDEDENQLGDFSNYNTVFRVLGSGVQYSDDRSVYIEPTVSVDISVGFFGEEDERSPIPDQVEIMTTEGRFYGFKEDDFRIVLKNVPQSRDVRVLSAKPVEGYETEIHGTTVLYNSTAPTWKERTDAQVLYTALMTDTLVETEL